MRTIVPLEAIGSGPGWNGNSSGFYNLLAYATPEGTRIRPFVTGGGHFSNFVPPGSSASYGQGSTKFGVNYGGGVKARISEKYQVRVDFRQYVTGKPFGGPYPSVDRCGKTRSRLDLGSFCKSWRGASAM